jgi:hypothetical protein
MTGCPTFAIHMGSLVDVLHRYQLYSQRLFLNHYRYFYISIVAFFQYPTVNSAIDYMLPGPPLQDF